MYKIYQNLLMGCILLCSLLSPLLMSAQDDEIKGDLANVVTEDSRPNWIELNPDANLDPKAFINLLNSGNSLAEGSSVNLAGQSVDQNGQTRHIYQQYYQSIPIDNYLWVLHSKKGVVSIAQGTFFEQPTNTDPRPVLNGSQALRIALETVNANQYAWQVPSLEQDLKSTKGDPNATYYPQANLVWVEEETNGALKLAYKFDIYAIAPLSRKEYFIDAKTGLFLRSLDLLYGNCFGESTSEHAKHSSTTANKIQLTTNTTFADSSGTGIANYIAANGGLVDITTDFNGTDFTLNTSGLGPLGTQEIQTKNANNFWNYNNLTDFEDADNVWDTDPIAVGAHWGATQAYNYFLDTFNRKSYDDTSATVITVVHYGQDLVNAYWDGTRMTFGDGTNISWSALTSLDIIAHEFTHGVTEYNGTGGLVYLDESGALNESFSDIFGAVVEHLYHPDGGDWLIGEDFDIANQVGFRNMADPHTAGHPKTYLGTNWFDGAGDNGGVHVNSGVQNYWFYLLAAGGNGTNEFGYNYDITAIGLQKAAAISYYNLTHYMTPNATYQDAMNGAIMSAQVLYPGDTEVQNAVADAWCAVGLGNGCGPTIVIDEPMANQEITAGQNFTVTWTNTLLSATSKVKIEYTTDTGSNPVWHFIADNISNSGAYSWLVPSDYSTTVRVRVTDDGDPATGRVSNSDILGMSELFEIGACNAINSFTGPSTAAIEETLDFTGNITGDAYQWKINGIEVGTAPDLSYTFTEAGIYEITYTVNSIANNCFNEESRRVYILKDNANGFALQFGDIDNGGGRAYSQEILETADGGFVFVSIFTGRVYKVDALGNSIWNSTAFPALSYPNYRASAIEKSDGNILIALGFSPSSGTFEDDNLLILEVDGTDGSFINNTSKQLEVTGRLMPFQIIATDTSYIIGGAYQNSGAQNTFLVHLKATDFSIIDQVWIGNDARPDYYGDLIRTSDGGFLYGWAQNGAYPEYFGLIKYDENFQEEWKEGLYSNNARPGSRSRMELLEIPDCGGYMVLADADEYANSALVKLNVLGNVQWAKRYSAPDALDGELIAFLDMAWDGNDGVTLLGINGTALNSNNYPTAVDYQMINVNFDGQLNWKRRIDDLNLIIPSGPSYNLFTTDIIATSDGGYLATASSGDGGESHLIKTDSMGLDGCVMVNTNINEEDITSSFNIELAITTALANDPVIQKIADYPFNITPPIVTISAPKCGNIGNPLIAAYTADDFTILVNTSPSITNLSRGATSETWKVDGSVVSFPLPNFTSTGVYEITLEVSDGSTTSSVTYDLNVVDDNGCELPCDLVKTEGRIIAATCPDTEDAEVITDASSAIGRNLYYELYDDNSNLLIAQNIGRFTGLGIGTYQVIVKSINDATCELDLGTYNVEPRVDNNPPQANCVSSTVDAAFVHAAVGIPYNHLNYIQEMDGVFGDDWHQLTYEGVNPERLFSDSYNFVYLEGTDNNANELATFLGANQQLIEDWVAAGNALFLNAAPNEGTDINFGFGGVQLVRGFYTTAIAVDPTLPMFNGPLTPVLTTYGGTFSLGAVIIPPGMDTTRILESDNGTDLLVQANWGDGKVLFGGMNLTGYHQPQAESLKFRRNILHHLKSLPIATVNSPIVITLDENQTYSLAINEIDLGSFDDCGLLNVALDTSEFTCVDIGILDVALVVTDVANNVATCTTQVQIIDTTKTIIVAEICQGDSYDFDNELIMSSGVFQSILQNTLGCDSLVELTLTVTTDDTTRNQLIASICEGEIYTFKGEDLTLGGTYLDTSANASGCVNILELTLSVNDTSHTEIAESICQGDTYSFNELDLTEAGIYFDTLQNSNQCDSFLVLNLSIRDTSHTVINESICQGDTYFFNELDLTEAGVYLDTLQNSNQCDSFLTLTLSIRDTSLTEMEATICQGDTYSFNNQQLTNSGIYRDTLLNFYQCDSFLVLNLTVNDTAHTEIETTICQGDTYLFNEVNLTNAGVYFDTLQNNNQCDSFLVLTLSIVDTSHTEIAESICQGDTYSFNELDLTEAGIYFDTLQNSNQCDSFLVLNLSIRDTSHTVINESICQGDTYFFNELDLTEAGVYLDTLQNSNQCDSFLTLTLSIRDTSLIEMEATICQGDTYSFNNQQLTNSGIYRDTLLNFHQCDSFLVLNLTVNDTAHTEIETTICQGDTYLFNEVNLTNAGVYFDTLQNTNQCDSFLVLTLSIVDTSHTEIAESICQGDTYSFNELDLTEAGIYFDTLQNSNQCDSFLVLNLSIRDTSHTVINESICQGDTYFFNDLDLTEAGVYLDTLQNSNQCDSFLTLTLSIRDTSLTEMEATICQGDTYSFNNQQLTNSGIYRDTLLNFHQCDSFLVLNLTVNDTALIEISESICIGESYTFKGIELVDAGTYRDTLLSEMGCDSLVVLTLNVTDCSGQCTEDRMVLNAGPIAENHYQAAISVTSASTLEIGTTIFQAGDTITLLPSFHAMPGSEFTATIDPATCDESPSLRTNATTNFKGNQSTVTIDELSKNELSVSPNPFYQTTNIELNITTPQSVSLAIYSIDGQLISTLHNGQLPIGKYTQSFDGRRHKAGMYFVVLQTKESVLTKKIIRIE